MKILPLKRCPFWRRNDFALRAAALFASVPALALALFAMTAGEAGALCGKMPAKDSGAMARATGMPVYTPAATMGAGQRAETKPTGTAGQSAEAGAQEELGAERQAELVHLVRQDCGSCHGMTLKGGLGKPLLPENVRDIPQEALAAIILDGVPDTPMPPWRGLLSEKEANWIAERLKKGLPK